MWGRPALCLRPWKPCVLKENTECRQQTGAMADGGFTKSSKKIILISVYIFMKCLRIHKGLNSEWKKLGAGNQIEFMERQKVRVIECCKNT